MAQNLADRTFSPTIDSNKVAVASGGTVSLFNIKAPATIFVEPGGGGTMTVQVRLTEGGTLIDADADNASFSADTVFTLNSSVYELVFGAVSAAGDGSVAICR